MQNASVDIDVNLRPNGLPPSSGESGGAFVEYSDIKIAERLRGTHFDINGQVFLLSFEILINRLGARWNAKKDLIWEHVQSCFDRRFTKSDWCMQVSETSWIFVLPSKMPQQGAKLTAAIFEDTLQFFVGEINYSNLPLFEVYVDSVSRLYLKRVPIEAYQIAISPNANVSAIDTKNIELRTENNSNSGVSLGIESIEISDSLAVYSAIEPIYVTKDMTIIGHRIKPYVIDLRSGIALNKKIILGLPQNVREEIDIANVKIGVRQITQFPREQRKILLTVPLGFSTINSGAARGKILSFLSETSKEFGLSTLFEVRNLEKVPEYRIVETLSFLRPHCKAIIGHIGSDLNSANELKGCRLGGIGLDFEALKRDANSLPAYVRTLLGLTKIIPGSYIMNGFENVSQIESASKIGITHATLSNEKHLNNIAARAPMLS